MDTKRKIALLFVSLWVVVAGCTTSEQRRQEDTRLIIEYALSDFPIPQQSEISEDQTVILGAGNKWSGKVTFFVGMTPQELVKFYNESTPQAGWEMTTSTISEGVILSFQKENRFATVEINLSAFINGMNFISKKTTKVTISLNHSDSIDKTLTQN